MSLAASPLFGQQGLKVSHDLRPGPEISTGAAPVAVRVTVVRAAPLCRMDLRISLSLIGIEIPRDRVRNLRFELFAHSNPPTLKLGLYFNKEVDFYQLWDIDLNQVVSIYLSGNG